MMRSPIGAGKGFSRTSSILSWVILLVGIITIGFSTYMAVVSYSSLPYWDGWIQINFAAEGGNPFTFDWLWSQYNEHRMPIPKLFLLTDLHWFHARQVFLLLSIFAIQFLHLMVLSWSMRAFGNWRGAVWRTGVGLAAFCLFCPSQWENLTWGMQVCFVLPGLVASLSFVGLLLYWMRSNETPSRSSSNWKYLLLSLATALVATWSYVNGNLLWPLLLAAALLLRLRLAAVLSYAIAGTLSTAVYLQNYIRPSYAANSMKTPANMLEHLAAYFGSSWVGSSSSFRLAEVIGTAGLVVCFLLLFRLPSYVKRWQPFNIQLVLTLLFCAGTGLTTSVGRSGFGVSQAFSSRYQTVSLVFWCCLGLLLLGAAATPQRMRNNGFVLVQLTLLVIMLVGARYAKTPFIRARVRGIKLNTAAMSLVTNVPDIGQFRWAFWQPNSLPSFVPYMRRERLSVFDDPNSWLLSRPLESAFNLAPANECAGELETSVVMRSVAAGPAALRITGWAWDYKRREPPSAIVAATDGIITGLGAMGDYRPVNKTVRPWITSNYIGYTGYVQGARASGPVEIYAILKGRPATACLIATVK
jgi:hypothetical protein